MQQARELRRHELPDGDLARIVERALDLLIADRMVRSGRDGLSRGQRAGLSDAIPVWPTTT